jgi:uncharacterized protein (DUF433 family)
MAGLCDTSSEVIEMVTEIAEGITVDPKVMVGKPVIKGTRMPVSLVLAKLSANLDVDDLLSDYPHITRDQVKDCLRYASQLALKDRHVDTEGIASERVSQPAG